MRVIEKIRFWGFSAWKRRCLLEYRVLHLSLNVCHSQSARSVHPKNDFSYPIVLSAAFDRHYLIIIQSLTLSERPRSPCDFVKHFSFLWDIFSLFFLWIIWKWPPHQSQVVKKWNLQYNSILILLLWIKLKHLSYSLDKYNGKNCYVLVSFYNIKM